MDVRTFRAKSMHDALAMVRRQLGPDAAVLQTREVRDGLWWWLPGGRRIEVTASTSVRVPSRFGGDADQADPSGARGEPEPRARDQDDGRVAPTSISPADADYYRAKFRDDLKSELADLQSMVEDLCRNSTGARRDLPESLFHLFTDLIEAEVSEELARELIDRIRHDLGPGDLGDPLLMKARMARMIEEEIRVAGPIRPTPGRRHVVALVGPTGVGKTTTIAKLAANFRLRERRRVGLITVDTYRIAAVEQLRTYADIIDLPMEIVSTPKEMREAVKRLEDQELVLMDTAGRSPRDEVRIQELKSMLAEARADEVQLVLSSVSSLAGMKKTAARFARVGATSLILTKLDEATGLGNLLPLIRECRLPLSYVTNGQNVPDDIEAAEPGKLARVVLGMREEL